MKDIFVVSAIVIKKMYKEQMLIYKCDHKSIEYEK